MTTRFFERGRTIVGIAGLCGMGIFSYKIGYPYLREMYLAYWKIDEADGYSLYKLEKLYKTLQDSTANNSLLKKHLTAKVKDKLKYKRTKLGATLNDVIKSGIENIDSSIGIYAPDRESYKLFSSLFDPIIKDYHSFEKDDSQPDIDFGEDRIPELTDLDPEGKYIESTRIRCARSLAGYPFNPLLIQDDYLIMEEKIRRAFKQFDQNSELKGTYFPLQGMSKEIKKQLIADHFLFKEDDRFLKSANACHFWPHGRGIYHNTAKTFLIWVNEEDHLRIISMQKGGNVGEVLQRLNNAVEILEQRLVFARDGRLGWLTFCPSNLGTTIRASVHIKLPKISSRPDFQELCKGLNLQTRGIHGEHSENVGNVYDVSNKRRLGLTEFEAVKEMYDGVKKLIEMEKNAE